MLPINTIVRPLVTSDYGKLSKSLDINQMMNVIYYQILPKLHHCTNMLLRGVIGGHEQFDKNQLPNSTLVNPITARFLFASNNLQLA